MKKTRSIPKRTAAADAELELTPAADNKINDFDASIDNLRPEDINVSKQKKKASKKKPKHRVARILRSAILYVCIAVFVGCAIWLVFNFIGKAEGNKMYAQIDEEVGGIFSEIASDGSAGGDGAVDRLASPKPAAAVLCMKDRVTSDGSQNGSSDDKIAEMRARLSDLQGKFPDLYGWIYVDGTAINYPLVKGTDNLFYLDHSPYKLPLVNGSIFVDYTNNTSIMRNFNTVMYGHNLTGGGMFHDVEASFFYDEEKFRNTYIYIYTMDGVYIYEPFSVYSTRSDYPYFRTGFVSTADFVSFAYEVQANSKYQKDMEFTATDRIITLSTCTNRESWGRYALHAKLVQVLY